MSLDLSTLVPDTIALMEARGEPVSVVAVLDRLGLEMASTLASPAPPASPERELDSLGRFVVTRELGRGGMGRVVAAHDPELGRDIAVKVVLDPRHVPPSRLARFVVEARLTAQLQHPNIVPVHEMGMTEDGLIYFVMKQIDGRSLGEVLALLRVGDPETTERWTRHRLLTAFVQVCNAVAYAHDRGVLHRDLKPSNIMVGAYGEVLVVDWGLARLLSGPREDVRPAPSGESTPFATLDGMAVGTPGYMSPEAARGAVSELDPRSDIYGLGACLYELLTLCRAHEGSTAEEVIRASIAGQPQEPQVRAPQRGIPDEIAVVCMRALSADPEDRFATATELAAAVGEFLEGSRRREAAQERVEEAEVAWARHQAIEGERAALLGRLQTLKETSKPWTPLPEKAELLATRRRLGELGPDRARWLAEVHTRCDKALSHDPENAGARALLARVHYARFEEAELARDEEARLFHERRVRAYDDGRYAPLLRGTGALSLRTDPPGAEVVCERYDTTADLVWPLVERRVLGTTPLLDVPLEQGSYLLTIRSPGKRDTRYPVFIPRGRRWDAGEAPVPLYTDAEIGDGCVYVPPGPFVFGGDERSQNSPPRSELWLEGFFLAVFPVTMGGYCEFINALHGSDPEQAWSRVPRLISMAGAADGQLWVRPGEGEAYEVPERDKDGDRWDPRWPVLSVSWQDARAYAAWRSQRDGGQLFLPDERQWEKGARGVDGRIHPWGDGFDPTLCKMRDSRAGQRLPEPVGAFATDVSPYGVRDLAGGVRDWCGDERFETDPTHRPARGGSWNNYAARSRLPCRGGDELWAVYSNTGFRLARIPTDGGGGA